MNPQDPNTPKYNTTTGLLTDYGKSLGMKEVNPASNASLAINTTITPESINNKETPIVTPPGGTLTPGTTEPILPDATSELDKETERLKAQKQTEVGGITDVIKQLGIEQGKEAEYIKEEGGDTAQKEYDRLSKELESEKLALRRKTDEVRKTFGGTTAGLQNELGRIERESISKQADLAMLGNFAKGQYDTARDIAQRKVESAVAPLKAELEAKKFIFENNAPLFTKAESTKLDKLLTEEADKIEREEKNLQTIEDIKIEAAKNGMTNISGFAKVKTVDEALQVAGKYLSTPNTEVVKLDSGSTVVIDKRTGKIINTLGGAKSTNGAGSGSITPEFSSIISRTAALEGTVAGKESVAGDLSRYLSNQDYSSAYNQIENTVMGGLSGTDKTTFTGARIDSEILKNLKTKITEFENKAKLEGIPTTGLLSGTKDKISRKLLGVTGSPELTSLAVGLEREFQKYRVGMTGAAFSPKESRDYASVNPKTTNRFDLNMATIDGAISQLDNRVNSTVDATVRGAGDIRKLAEIPKKNQQELKSNPFLQVSQSVGQVYNPNKGWIIPTN